MLDFVIFAITFVVFLVILVFYLYPGSTKETTIPGLDPSDSKDGNISDIIQAGSLHQFLEDLHQRFGDIASFWMGRKTVVSISSKDLFEQHKHVFDKPEDLLALYRPVVGDNSLLFANGANGRRKRLNWEHHLDTNHLSRCIPVLKEMLKELLEKWRSLSPDQHIPLHKYMVAHCMKAASKFAFGAYFDNPKIIIDFNRNFEICWTELEAQASGSVTDPKSPRNQRLASAVQEMRATIKSALLFMRSENVDNNCFLGTLLRKELPENEILDDSITFIFKYYSLASALTWTLYYLASHRSAQDKLFKELTSLKTDPITMNSLPKYRYLQAVIKESLRMSKVESWTARCQDLDVEIGGHIIPAKTSVIQALGVALQSDQQWDQPERFDPSRFLGKDEEGCSEVLLAQAFGFSGKRGCPAKELAILQMCLLVSELCGHFSFFVVEGQEVFPLYRMCTRTEDEVWVTIMKRP